jgi:hypothetical protein
MNSCKDDNKAKNDNFPKDFLQPQKIQEKQLPKIDVISMKSGYSEGKIIIYNSDGSKWKEFEFTDNFSDSSISPFAEKPENSLLVFRVVGEKDGMYAIKVNEKLDEIKYMKPNETFFEYQTWQQNILKAFSIEFNEAVNPLKLNPDSKSTTIPYDDEQFYHPVSIQGDWLKVKDGNNTIGWLRWRDEKGMLVIEIVYDA